MSSVSEFHDHTVAFDERLLAEHNGSLQVL
jgi:hypothetical protein